MNVREIYNDIALRSGGDIYIGVVGPVRSGKSTFINRFMESAVIPNIQGEYDRKRARDELPQSAQGKTVMTSEPKFVPDDAVTVSFGDGVTFRMRMIDCVGYMIPDALGLTENGEIRLVNTPWSNEPVPFEKAAEMGTKRVMQEHSSVGMLITSDGTVGEIPRSSYIEAEERIVKELKAVGKPFVLILNSSEPNSEKAESTAIELENKYNCPVALINCMELDLEDVESIMEMLLYEFPVTEIKVQSPQWLTALGREHKLSGDIIKCLRESAVNVKVLSDIRQFTKCLRNSLVDTIFDGTPNEEINVDIISTDLSDGKVLIKVGLPLSMYYKTISDISGLLISDEAELIKTLLELSQAKAEYDKYKNAISSLESNGYGIVMPEINDLILDEPEVIRNSGAYGVKLKARAESIHMIKANIETEINPIVGTQDQAEEIIERMIREYEDEPTKLWESNIFGKSIYELVNDGLEAKITHLSNESRKKLSDTLSRIVNESSNGLICILL